MRPASVCPRLPPTPHGACSGRLSCRRGDQTEVKRRNESRSSPGKPYRLPLRPGARQEGPRASEDPRNSASDLSRPTSRSRTCVGAGRRRAPRSLDRPVRQPRARARTGASMRGVRTLSPISILAVRPPVIRRWGGAAPPANSSRPHRPDHGAELALPPQTEPVRGRAGTSSPALRRFPPRPTAQPSPRRPSRHPHLLRYPRPKAISRFRFPMRFPMR